MPTVVDEAVVLRVWEFSETSQTVSLLTRAGGRLRGLAKGARRERSPFSGGFEALSRGEVVAIVKPSTDLATITEWDLREVFRGPRVTLAGHHAGLYLAEVTHLGVADDDPHPGLFDALVDALRALDAPGDASAGLLAFQWALLRETGVAPALDPGDRPAGVTLGFDPAHGRFVRDPGPASGREVWRVRRATLDALAAVVEPGAPLHGPPAPEDLDRANRLLAHYIAYTLGREPATRRLVFGPP